MMEIKTKTARSENYGRGRSKSVRYIVIHYTGNYGDTAANNAAFFARFPKRSAHFFADEHEVWNSVPGGSTAWHVSASAAVHTDCRNENSIGVEICMLDRQGKVRQRSIDHAAAFVRELMREYGIPADYVLRHYDVTHKSCPAPMVSDPALWRVFEVRIQEEDDMKYYEKITEIPAGEMRETVQLLIDRKAIAGNGAGLHLSEDMVQMMVYNRRMGLYE